MGQVLILLLEKEILFFKTIEGRYIYRIILDALNLVSRTSGGSPPITTWMLLIFQFADSYNLPYHALSHELTNAQVPVISVRTEKFHICPSKPGIA